MNHFLEISQLSKQAISSLLERALYFKKSKKHPNYSTSTAASLFYENSTRTRVSFELAAQRLSIPFINLDLQTSSEIKGEAIEDTIKTLAAMGINLFVVRHSQDGLPQELANRLSALPIHLINAGDGKHAHPSQAMLDLLTISEQKGELSRLKVAILGDVRHSRVANSLQSICALFEAKLSLIAPKIWQPLAPRYGEITTDLAAGLTEADVIICLRVQKERLLENESLDLADYRRNYALTSETLRYARPDAMIMHPGPINRGIEIDSDVADGPQSYILQQVSNGVVMRMAILEALVKNTLY